MNVCDWTYTFSITALWTYMGCFVGGPIDENYGLLFTPVFLGAITCVEDKQ